MAPKQDHVGAPGVRLMAAVLAASVVLSAAAGAIGAAESPGRASSTDKELERLRSFLVGPDRTFPTRRDAAEALVEKDTEGSRAVLVEVLATPSEAALAVLDVLASKAGANEAFLDPLFGLLTNDDAEVRRRAALAFGAYPGSDRVVTGLNAILADTALPRQNRLAAVEALAQIVDPRSIEALVAATDDADSAVASAADRALSDMTGLEGAPAGGWTAWWNRREMTPEAEFLRGLLRRFRAELRARDAALDSARARISRLLNEMYRVADVNERARLIREHLGDTLADVRAVAARQAALLAGEVLAGNGNGREAYQDLLSALTVRLGDDSPEVKAAAAEALAAWQEKAAGPALLARLSTETVPEVRAAIASALGALKEAEAVPKLVAMLDSPHSVEVVRAAGALGAIGERNGAAASAAEAAAEPLGKLALEAPEARVREAGCRALARIRHAGAEQILVQALADPDASVRFSAAQGLGNMGRARPPTLDALSARLQDDNKGVRQAAAAALGKLGGPESARKMTARLGPGAEADPAVRNALWAATQGLVARQEGPELAEELADAFAAHRDPESTQRAAALLEVARDKYPPSEIGSEKFRTLLEKLVDAHLAAGTPRRAVPALRQLLDAAGPDEPVVTRRLKRQLGMILLPDPDAGALLAEAMEGLEAAERLEIARAVHGEAEALLKAGQAVRGFDLLEAFRRGRPDWGGTDLSAVLAYLYQRLKAAAISQLIVRLSGTPEAEVAAATARLKALGTRAVTAMLDALEAAAMEGQSAREEKILAGLEAITGRQDHGYDPNAPLRSRLAAVEAWRERLSNDE